MKADIYAASDPRLGNDFGQRALVTLQSEEANVRAVVGKVQPVEADTAIVYASDVTPAVGKNVQRILIPDQFNVIAAYPSTSSPAFQSRMAVALRVIIVVARATARSLTRSARPPPITG